MAINTLNDKQIRSGIKQHDEKVAAKVPGAKMLITTMPDGGGLRLEIRDTGQPKWVYRYTRPMSRKINEMRIGTYPDIPLSKAREIASGLRGKVQEGIDPQIAKVEAVKATTAEAEKKARTFGVLVHEFMNSQDWAEGTEKLNRIRVKKYMVKLMGMQLDEITPRFLVEDILRPIRQLETQKRVRLLISQAYKYAIVVGDTFSNPARDIALVLKPPVNKHFAAPTSLEELKTVWQGIDVIKSNQSRNALKLQFLTFQRPFNVRAAEWAEFDLENGIWRIPLVKMKLKKNLKEEDPQNRRPHIVPLSRQAVDAIKNIIVNDSRYCFPSIRSNDRPITDATLLAAMRGAGITQEQSTCHGSRAAASTLLNESGLWSSDAIERQLAHVLPGGDVRNAYNRSDFLEERTRMMQYWGDLLDSLN